MVVSWEGRDGEDAGERRQSNMAGPGASRKEFSFEISSGAGWPKDIKELECQYQVVCHHLCAYTHHGKLDFHSILFSNG